jgi:ABC-type uncharacterized transport system involved in gliding motility auxiliary subunit
MEDPTPVTQFGEENDSLADMLDEDWGIGFNNDVIIDLQSTEPTFAVSMIPYGSHAITTGMNNIVSIYPFSRSLNTTNSLEGVTITPLVTTGQNSWGETDFDSLTQNAQVRLDDDESVGPLTLAVAAENSTTNGSMLVNSVDWSAEKENLVNITPKNTTERTFNVPSQLHWILILLSSIFIIPGLVVLGGVSAWLARRRQG